MPKPARLVRAEKSTATRDPCAHQILRVLGLAILNSSSNEQDGPNDSRRARRATTGFYESCIHCRVHIGHPGDRLLLYCVSPVLLLVRAAEQRQINPVLPILGGSALVCGMVLLFVSRPRS